MIDLELIRNTPNPYKPEAETNLSNAQFIGRIEELNTISTLVDDFQNTGKINNILITGHRSIGKTALLEQYEHRLESIFALYKKKLSLYQTEDILEFFIELIDYILDQFESSEGFFDETQIEIWRNLIYQGNDNSNYIDRKLQLATLYSLNKTVRYSTIKKDISTLVGELLSADSDTKGLVIIIDEFQEFSKNQRLLEILTNLSNEIDNFGIIGAGSPDIFVNTNTFHKFNRSSMLIELKQFSDQEIEQAFFSPPMERLRYNQYEIENLFTPECLRTLIERTAGNPYHIRILCSEIWEYFKSNQHVKKLTINREIMDRVMIQYSRLTENSKKIQNSLKTCNKDKLDAFGRLFQWEGFDLNSIILCKIAFDNITEEKQEIILNSILKDFISLRELELFTICDSNNIKIDINKLAEVSVNQSSQFYYRFIGDQMDKLYASYYYESLMDKKLTQNRYDSLEDVLANIMSMELSNSLLMDEIEPDSLAPAPYNTFYEIEVYDRFGKDLKKISNLSDRKKLNLTKTLRIEINNIANRLDLVIPSIIAHRFQYEGYYSVLINANIRGKLYNIRVLFPVKKDKELVHINKKLSNYSKYYKASLDEYLISVNSIHLTLLPKFIPLLIFQVTEQDFIYDLIKYISERNFEKAAKIGEVIFGLSHKIDTMKKQIWMPLNALNNYAFCLINVNELNKAEKNFNKIKDKFILSKINLAYIYFLQKDMNKSKSLLKIIKNKVKNSNEVARFLHLTLSHKKINYSHSLVENISYYNLCCWNLMLIAAQLGNNIVAFNSFKKLPKPRNRDERFIQERVLYWSEYYLGNKENALKNSNLLKNKINADSYLYREVCFDIDIFREESSVQ